MLNLSFPISGDSFVLLSLYFKFEVKFIDLCLEFLAFCSQLVHAFGGRSSSLLHVRLNQVDLVHILLYYGLLSGNLSVQFIDWKVSTNSALFPQISDLLPNLRKVTLTLLLLVGFALCLNCLDSIRHHHVQVEYALADVLILFSHKEEYVT